MNDCCFFRREAQKEQKLQRQHKPQIQLQTQNKIDDNAQKQQKLQRQHKPEIQLQTQNKIDDNDFNNNNNNNNSNNNNNNNNNNYLTSLSILTRSWGSQWEGSANLVNPHMSANKILLKKKCCATMTSSFSGRKRKGSICNIGVFHQVTD